MKFETKLQVESITGKLEWYLIQDLIFITKDGRRFKLERDEKTDFFSIPGVLRSFLFRSRKYAEAAVMHDGGYRGKLWEWIDDKWVKVRLSRDYVDEYLLKDPLECLGAPTSLQNTLYWGVRLGGRWSFKG